MIKLQPAVGLRLFGAKALNQWRKESLFIHSTPGKDSMRQANSGQRSLWSYRSMLSMGSIFSLRSIFSFASIGSAGSILSIGGAGGILRIGKRSSGPFKRDEHAD